MPFVGIDHLEPEAAQVRTTELLVEAHAHVQAMMSHLVNGDQAGWDAAIRSAQQNLSTLGEYAKVAFMQADMTPEQAVMVHIGKYPHGYWHHIYVVTHAVRGIDPRLSDEQIRAALDNLANHGYLKMVRRGGGRQQYQLTVIKWQGVIP